MPRRHDGRPAEVPPYRRIMPYLMRGKNEAAVYFEQTLDVTRTQAWLDAWNADPSRPRATVFHVILHALATVLYERPHLNRFVVGRRIFDRKGVFISFAAKKAMRDDAPLATVKHGFPAGESFADMMTRVTGEVREARSDKKSRIDKELSVLLKLPGLILAFAVSLLRRLDRWGLAPRSMLDPDPLYTSAFVANLGSIRIDAAYHHLYEYGNCPLFVTIGQVQPRALVEGDRVVVKPTVLIRYTYDERIEDGFYCAAALELLRRRVEDPGQGQDVPVSASASA
jgi:hypothetical protein